MNKVHVYMQMFPIQYIYTVISFWAREHCDQVGHYQPSQ